MGAWHWEPLCWTTIGSVQRSLLGMVLGVTCAFTCEFASWGTRIVCLTSVRVALARLGISLFAMVL